MKRRFSNRYHKKGESWIINMEYYFDHEFTFAVTGTEIIRKVLNSRIRLLINDYYVSDDGKIYRLRYLSNYMWELIEIVPTKNNAGYMQVSNPYKGCGAIGVHQLVAQAFIPNPYNKKEVNHKNRNKEDNSVENLEWVTHQENMDHYYREIRNEKR